FGELVDPFGGVEDIQNRIIRTPLGPDITFSDDPLRMMRAIRFATQLNFKIDVKAVQAIAENAERIKIISKECVIDELNKIVMAAKPSVGFRYIFDTELLKNIFPGMYNIHGVDIIDGRGNKDNFYNTLEVLDTVAANSDNL